MDNLSLFVDILKDLINEKNISPDDIHRKSGIGLSAIYSWLKCESIPSMDSLASLADYFDCSIDYLVGRSEHFSFVRSKENAAFKERFRQLIESHKISRRKLSAMTRLSMNSIHCFLTGKSKPLFVNLIKLANLFDCSIDYLVGRSDNV